MIRNPSRLRLPLLAAALLAAVSACSRDTPLGLLSNQRPTVEITQAPTRSDVQYFYAYEIRWAGYDTDGRIDYFLYAIDPPTAAGSDTVWTRTTENRKTFLFHADHIDTTTSVTASGYHTFVVKAVDDRGQPSAPQFRSFTSYTVAPTVQILRPTPSHLLYPTLGPTFRVTWVGSDPDGQTTRKPVKYKYKLLYDGGLEFDMLLALQNPDSLRSFYAPTFATWDSVGGDTSSAVIHDLVPDRNYLLIVVAFDEVGAYSPTFNADVNMLYFQVSYAGLLGPKFTIYNQSFNYTAISGGYSREPQVTTEVPAGTPINFNWFATTPSGVDLLGYRWAVDLKSLEDETPRSDEHTDITHWSHSSALNTAAVLPAYNNIPPGGGSQQHFLYVEAEDSNHQRSLIVVAFSVVRPDFDRPLLFVDDTRMAPDKLLADGTLDRPRGVWPTAAEIDTFFFARGGVPWRSYPVGTLSPPGVFAGYDFDTVGSRFVPGGDVTLSMLGHYRHVVWYTDLTASGYVNAPGYPQNPICALRWMGRPGRSNPLATWITQGGKLWLFGGGAATALQKEWEVPTTLPYIYSHNDGELVAGRFMYDLVHWRSEITINQSAQATRSPAAVGGWPGAPDYSLLPATLNEKVPSTDPIPPNRTVFPEFFQGRYNAEFLTRANGISEDIDPDPEHETQAFVLDTLYTTVGGNAGSFKPVMTLYHGVENPTLVFSGFPLWYFRRTQILGVADFVLQQVWGLPRQNVAR